MGDEQLVQWERLARDAAEKLSETLEKSAPHDLELANVPAAAADGSNQLDDSFVDRVKRREHLTDDFLKDA